jgi:hypothetical protein
MRKKQIESEQYSLLSLPLKHDLKREVKSVRNQ